jgi:hypothetical protein
MMKSLYHYDKDKHHHFKDEAIVLSSARDGFMHGMHFDEAAHIWWLGFTGAYCVYTDDVLYQYTILDRIQRHIFIAREVESHHARMLHRLARWVCEHRIQELNIKKIRRAAVVRFHALELPMVSSWRHSDKELFNDNV